LEESVESARIVEPGELPRDIVTSYSQVRLRDVESGLPFIITVTLPADAEARDHRSFWRTYATAALLGAREGDDLVWRSAHGLCRARVEQVLIPPQPPGRDKRTAEFYDAVDLRLMDTFPASDAVARY
jgi:hypothetical protein